MNVLASFQADLTSVEVARKTMEVESIVLDLLALSGLNETTIEVGGSFIIIHYEGRGIEKIQLKLSSDFRDSTRIDYMRDVIMRLKKIKTYIEECAA